VRHAGKTCRDGCNQNRAKHPVVHVVIPLAD
jgi:hypothetical protein